MKHLERNGKKKHPQTKYELTSFLCTNLKSLIRKNKIGTRVKTRTANSSVTPTHDNITITVEKKLQLYMIPGGLVLGQWCRMAVAKAAISLLLLTLLNRTNVVDICRTQLVQLKQSTRLDQLRPVVTHVRVKTHSWVFNRAVSVSSEHCEGKEEWEL